MPDPEETKRNRVAMLSALVAVLAALAAIVSALVSAGVFGG
ncbi:hypothetical protein [Parvularcula dongshanensis]|uniref:Uncharacterized protein n=1 Tax=Parvularcula dongshanensis TaxID=1173995 RepID=A0A840I0A5_9PROT|nr:hypothetical protein [Parvularcula dongshanensis]MBB4657775.1 hypothetical protein [Parvularcula dongshanensis]